MYRCGTEYRTPLTLGAAAPTVCESVHRRGRRDTLRVRSEIASCEFSGRTPQAPTHATTIRSHPPPKQTAEGLSKRRRGAIARGTSQVERSRGLQPCARPDRDAWARAGFVCVSRREPALNLFPRPSPPLAPAPHVPRPFGRSGRRSVPMGEALSTALSTALSPWAVCSRGSVRSAGAGGCRRGRGRRRAPNRRPRRDPQRSRACRAMAPWRRRRAAAR